MLQEAQAVPTNRWWKVSLEDFRRLLDVPKSYRPSEINKYVLKPIEEELGPLLNLKVHRKYLKKKPGRGRASLCRVRI